MTVTENHDQGVVISLYGLSIVCTQVCFQTPFGCISQAGEHCHCDFLEGNQQKSEDLGFLNKTSPIWLLMNKILSALMNSLLKRKQASLLFIHFCLHKLDMQCPVALPCL
jgi:hypothetical protein